MKFISIFFILLIACTKVDTAGGNGSETTNGIKATVVDTTGKVVDHAKVLVRKANHISHPDSNYSEMEFFTNQVGEVFLPVNDTMAYIVEANALNQNFMARVTSIEEKESVLRKMSLQTPSLLKGTLNRIEWQHIDTIVVQIVGLNRHVVLAQGESEFSFENLPSGTFQLLIGPKATSIIHKQQWQITLVSGQTLEMSFNLASLRISDSLAIRQILSDINSIDFDWETKTSWNETGIESLDLSEQKLSVLPEEIGFLQSLKKLNLENNGIVELPKTLAQNSVLEELTLSANALQYLPDWVWQKTSLQKLHVAKNHLTEIPTSIQNLTSLRSLNFSQNKIKSLPDVFEQFPYLDSVILDANELILLPESIGKMKQLKSFTVASNKLTSLPSSFVGLKNIKWLNFSENQLCKVSDEEKSFLDIHNAGWDLRQNCL